MILKKWLYGVPMSLYFLLLVLLLYLLPGFWLSVCRAQGSTPPGTGPVAGQPVPDVPVPTWSTTRVLPCPPPVSGAGRCWVRATALAAGKSLSHPNFY